MFKKLYQKYKDLVCNIRLSDKKLAADLNKRINVIAKRNQEFLLKTKLIPYVKSDAEFHEGLLLTERDAYQRALQLFMQQKKAGVVDILNRVVKIKG